jgi:GNAT superfamily N-acetyltransferase
MNVCEELPDVLRFAAVESRPAWPPIISSSSSAPGKGLGTRLLWDALNRSEEASQKVGSVAVIVDAKDDAAARFYERYGFRPLPESPHRLFITMATIAATRAAAE